MTDPSVSAVPAIIKTDQAGRVRYSREFRSEVLAAFDQSGMSGTAFAAHCGVKYATFAGWVSRAKRKTRVSAPDEGSQRFLLAEVGAIADDDSSSSGVIQITLPGGCSIELKENAQVDLLSSLLKSLA